MNQQLESPSIDTQDDRALLRLELRYATLAGMIGGYYWGLFSLGVVSLVLKSDLLKGFFYIVFMSLGLGVLAITDAILEYIRTHSRGLGMRWSYPPTLEKLVRMELMRVVITVLVVIVGLLWVRRYTSAFWAVVLGGMVVSLGNGLNAYFVKLRAQERRSISDVM